VQEQELHHDKEQKEALRPAGDKEILQYVPQAHGAQGSEVSFRFGAGSARRFWF
jgi:hypothetical protein